MGGQVHCGAWLLEKSIVWLCAHISNDIVYIAGCSISTNRRMLTDVSSAVTCRVSMGLHHSKADHLDPQIANVLLAGYMRSIPVLREDPKLNMRSGFSKPSSPGSRNVCRASVPMRISACVEPRRIWEICTVLGRIAEGRKGLRPSLLKLILVPSKQKRSISNQICDS